MLSLRSFRNYQSTLSHLWKIAKPGIRLDLSPIQSLMQALGEPWKAFPSVLIAGTNGKGSIAAMMSEVLAVSGYRVGVYSSPHLSSYRERICIRTFDSQLPFDEESWCANYGKLVQILARLEISLTQFELLTALCFLIFQEKEVDVAILEVGLGGRLDAVNVVEPVLSLIASIDYDHQKYLGETLASITREKAGILRKGKPAFVLQQSDVVMRAVQNESQRIGAELAVVQPGILKSMSLDQQCFSYHETNYRTTLLGEHQVSNACLAIEGALKLKKCGFGKITHETIQNGLATAQWPVRAEVIRRKPLIILDGAHNPHGARAFAKTLELLELPRPRVMILGVLDDKDMDGILQAFSDWLDMWIFCESLNPRAVSACELLEKARILFPARKLLMKKRVGEACRFALSYLDGNGTLCIAGSLTVAGEARRILSRRRIQESVF